MIDTGIYLFFFILGLFYLIDLNENKESELFIYHNKQPINIEQTQNDSLRSQFVASSRGKYFYPVDCDLTKSLSDKNKIYFDTKEGAQKSGFKEKKC